MEKNIEFKENKIVFGTEERSIDDTLLSILMHKYNELCPKRITEYEVHLTGSDRNIEDLVKVNDLRSVALILLIASIFRNDYSKELSVEIIENCIDALKNKTKLMIFREEDDTCFYPEYTLRKLKEKISLYEQDI